MRSSTITFKITLTAHLRSLIQMTTAETDDHCSGWWSEYNPDVNLASTANGYPLGETRIGDADFPAPVELQSLSGAGRGATVAGGVGGAGGGAGNVIGGAGRGAGLVFPQPMPPSAESLMEGAPQVVVEGELARLLADWTGMLEIIGQGFGPSE